ncbi:hypothetical protein BDN72DRAFT_403574 [Pluteus cervinus]|uniref:Uncharacterized protein n=1 Tax=Pluteus cervinus TaxID=181527 RepID=A0ACD3AA59_9AGAR|nr:hypothetical protein BDN72DRAFT_403574 [Pluteus cervinus]
MLQDPNKKSTTPGKSIKDQPSCRTRNHQTQPTKSPASLATISLLSAYNKTNNMQRSPHPSYPNGYRFIPAPHDEQSPWHEGGCPAWHGEPQYTATWCRCGLREWLLRYYSNDANLLHTYGLQPPGHVYSLSDFVPPKSASYRDQTVDKEENEKKKSG